MKELSQDFYELNQRIRVIRARLLILCRNERLSEELNRVLNELNKRIDMRYMDGKFLTDERNEVEKLEQELLVSI